MPFKSSSAFWEIVHFKVKLVDYTESNGHILKRGVNKLKRKTLYLLEREILQLVGLGKKRTLERMKIVKQRGRVTSKHGSLQKDRDEDG